MRWLDPLASFHLVLVLGAAVLVTVVSCGEAVPSHGIAGPLTKGGKSQAGCWPITPECQHRLFDPYEADRGYRQILSISNTYGVCVDLKNRLLNDFDVGSILMWTDGPPEYHPDDAFGDTHNDAGIVHLTANAFVGETNLELQKTLIHEGVHRLGTLDDYQADYWMEMCYSS